MLTGELQELTLLSFGFVHLKLFKLQSAAEALHTS